MFFIEMGQGIIGRADLVLTTSTMYSCTFIAGHNAESGYGGAYHYPSEALPNDDSDVIADMEVWASVLRPTQIILFFAAQDAMGQMGTRREDMDDLTDWPPRKVNAAPVIQPRSGSAAMELLADGTFAAGWPNNLVSDFTVPRINVSHRGSGRYVDHGGFIQTGENREN